MKSWVVDTCVVLDIALNDATHGVKSAQLLQSKLRGDACGVGPRFWRPTSGAEALLDGISD